MERRATHDLDVEVTLAERALGRLPHRRERLGEHVVEHLDALFLRVALRQPAPELVRHRPQRLVGARLHLGLEGRDLGHDRLDELELPAFARVKELVEEAHVASKCTDGRRRRPPGPAPKMRMLRP